jgi:hypothetical protein
MVWGNTPYTVPLPAPLDGDKHEDKDEDKGRRHGFIMWGRTVL